MALENVEHEIVVLDNASGDGSVEFVREHFSNVCVIANSENRGYAGGANDAIRATRGEYVMLLNPDIRLSPDYAQKLLARMSYAKDIGAMQGKLLQWDFEKNEATGFIDSAGLQMFKNRRCVDRGQGEEDIGQYERAGEVFGVTGACPLYRREALEDVLIDGEYFDESFFMYKEDVDLSWRLRLFGWLCFYDPEAIGYHGRGTGAVLRRGAMEVAKKRGGLSEFQRSLSYTNERLMRVKNELTGLFLRHALHILWKEFLMTGWIILRERFLFAAFKDFLKKYAQARKRRSIIMRQKRVASSEIVRWFE